MLGSRFTYGRCICCWSGLLVVLAVLHGCGESAEGQRAERSVDAAPSGGAVPRLAPNSGGETHAKSSQSNTAEPSASQLSSPDASAPPDIAEGADAGHGMVTETSTDDSDRVRVPKIFAPTLAGVLAGPGATPADGVQFYGTDLGWTFEHKGVVNILFGDTMPTARFYCDTPSPEQDDALGSLVTLPDRDVPEIRWITAPNDPSQLATIRVNRNAEPLHMGLGKTPLAGFSDGINVFAIMGHVEFTTCPEGSGDVCDENAGLTCVHDLGLCQPAVGDAVVGCTPGDPTNRGCILGQQCMAPATGYCVDKGSSQYDGTESSLPYAIARSAEIALQRTDEPAVWDSVHTFVSKKFHNPTVRTIKHIGDKRADYDYSPGEGGMLMWGRPAYFAEKGRQGQLYLLRHALPLQVNAGKLTFEPEFFAGVDVATGEPRWSRAQRDGVALAMDGRRNGDPAETLPVLNQMAISWLGEPINKWIMLYAGDVPDVMLLDAAAANATRGPLRVRFADYPWGPFSAAQTYHVPGDPAKVGDPYGPGGYLFHYACRDQPDQPCARTDPMRPTDAVVPGCPTPLVQLDVGRMYGANIIDAYTRVNGTGLDISWNISTWNPYAVLLMRSHLEPIGAEAPAGP